MTQVNRNYAYIVKQYYKLCHKTLSVFQETARFSTSRHLIDDRYFVIDNKVQNTYLGRTLNRLQCGIPTN